MNLAELEKFLINFVVEQTGYPPEVVELDADLEADLGIDSIKKAQMFGELQEYFDVTPTDNLTLDDFPTLRHIVNFLASVPQKGTAAATPPAVAAAPAPAPAAQPRFPCRPLPPAPVATAPAPAPLRRCCPGPGGRGTGGRGKLQVADLSIRCRRRGWFATCRRSRAARRRRVCRF